MTRNPTPASTLQSPPFEPLEEEARECPGVMGIDVGSRSIELAVLEKGRWKEVRKLPTTFDPLGQCRKLLWDAAGYAVVATGYGRKLVADSFPGLEVTTITEIQAYALGARHLFPRLARSWISGGRTPRSSPCRPKGR